MKIEGKKSKYSVHKHQGKQERASRAAKPDKPAKTPKSEKQVKKKTSGDRTRRTRPKISMPKIHLPAVDFSKIPHPKISLPALRLPKLLAGRREHVTAVVIALPALFIIAWLGLNLMQHEIPKPLFTETSLPALPPANINGYADCTDAKIVGEFARKDISDINIYSNITAIEPYLDGTSAEYAFVKEMAGRDDVRRLMDLYRRIVKKKAFADNATPGSRADAQNIRVYVAIHNAVLTTILARLQEKKYASAFKLTKDIMDLNVRFIQSTRSMTGFFTSTQVYNKSLAVLKPALESWMKVENRDGDAIASLRAIGKIIKSLTLGSLPIENIIKFEYMAALNQWFDPANPHPEASTHRKMNFQGLVFFDPGLTRKMLDERFEKILTCMKNPGEQCILELNSMGKQRYTDRSFWWFHNAVGKKYLDSIQLPVYQLLPEMKKWGKTIENKQNKIMSDIKLLNEKPGAGQKPARKRRPAGN